jgi:hypothetical protein
VVILERRVCASVDGVRKPLRDTSGSLEGEGLLSRNDDGGLLARAREVARVVLSKRDFWAGGRDCMHILVEQCQCGSDIRRVLPRARELANTLCLSPNAICFSRMLLIQIVDHENL